MGRNAQRRREQRQRQRPGTFTSVRVAKSAEEAAAFLFDGVGCPECEGTGHMHEAPPYGQMEAAAGYGVSVVADSGGAPDGDATPDQVAGAEEWGRVALEVETVEGSSGVAFLGYVLAGGVERLWRDTHGGTFDDAEFREWWLRYRPASVVGWNPDTVA